MRAAIGAAEAAFGGWRARPGVERGRLIAAWHDTMLANLDDLATIMTLEQGKPLAEARGEVRYAAGFLKWFAEESCRVDGDAIPAPTGDRRIRILVLKEPVGVAAAITP